MIGKHAKKTRRLSAPRIAGPFRLVLLRSRPDTVHGGSSRGTKRRRTGYYSRARKRVQLQTIQAAHDNT